MQKWIEKKKSERGVSLVILALTIIVMMIITGVIAVNTDRAAQAEVLTKLNNDLDVLKQRVNIYVATYNSLPTLKQYTDDLSHMQEIKNPNDSDTYYIIDIRLLSNLTLNFGEGFYDFVDGNSSNDVYIINEKTQTIYYVQGKDIDGQIRYRN